jgi:hypothetical protein
MTETTRQPLVAALLRVQNRIRRIWEQKESIGEQNTKAVLIDPVLSALGWSLEELDEVSPEYRRKPQDNPVDYALFMLQSPRLFVEAKALEKDLNDRKWISHPNFAQKQGGPNYENGPPTGILPEVCGPRDGGMPA